MRQKLWLLVTGLSALRLLEAAQDAGSVFNSILLERTEVDDINDSSTCRDDWDCPLESPMCDRGRLHCKDIWDFNASKGNCTCDNCSFQEIVKDPERNNVSDCVYECKIRPDCKGFQAIYTDEKTSVPKTFRCRLLRIDESSSSKFLTGDGQGDEYCFHKVANESQCARHITCLSAQQGHFCCPDRHGVMLWCCHYSNFKLGSVVIAILASLLALSVCCHCRGYGKSDAASPGNLLPDAFPADGAGANIEDTSERRRFVIAFVNKGSGDQRGERFERHLKRCMGEDGEGGEVFDLRDPTSKDTGLKLVEEKMKAGRDALPVAILACGGDGTVTWVLTELQKLHVNGRLSIEDLPPVGIIPLGTGNDLARSLGWGPALTDNSQLCSYIRRAQMADEKEVDQWKLTLEVKQNSLLPPALQHPRILAEGYFTNYFSVGLDAKTAYDVATARDTWLGKRCFQFRCCWPFRFLHGGLLCYCLKAPMRCLCCRTRPLAGGRCCLDEKEMHISFTVNGEKHQHQFQHGLQHAEVRQFTLANLNSYGAGMLLYSPEEISPNDGKLEVFTLEGPGGVIGMTLNKKVLKAPCGNIPLLAQPEEVEMNLQTGQYFQMDGEPWRLNIPCKATVKLNRRVKMLCCQEDGQGAGDWSGSQKRSFWDRVADTRAMSSLIAR